MFRHIVLVKWKPDATEAERETMYDAVEQLPAQIPEVAAACFGYNVGSGPFHYDMALVFDFEDHAAFDRYIASDAHQAYVQGPARIVEQLAVVQHTW